jgi:hypothetical protein
MKTLPASLLFITLLVGKVAYADDFGMFSSKHVALSAQPYQQVHQLVENSIDVSQYKKTRAQIIYNANHQPDHVLVYLFAKKTHHVDVTRIDINAQYHKTKIATDYQLTANDFSEQPGTELTYTLQCPDPEIQFIGFAPNDNLKDPDDVLEQTITQNVIAAANTHGLKTLSLLGKDATSANYLAAMTCPKLEGNFYDGDANPYLIVTNDGVISASEIGLYLKNQFRFKVVNIWLACEAYRDPFKSIMLTTTQSQKYAAGINNLFIGPSDRAASCTMIAALDGKPMTAAFQQCYRDFDKPEDHWGFDGNGSDYFGT